ncbi:MAG: tyrosine-type recombinase/integrase [Bifidobacterium animalis]|nr:tyrosine-type recombinase/integrase [Bifidobacterium animalis]
MGTKISAPPAWRNHVDKWIESLVAAGLSSETVKSRRYKLTRLAHLLQRGPDEVTTEQIVHVFASQSWRPETRKAYRTTAASFFRWMQRAGYRTEDVSEGLPSIRKPQPHPRPCPDRHISAALSRAQGMDAIMLRLAAECGLRRGEIARVHSDDVVADSGGKSLIVRGKGDKQRLVPLPADLAGSIEAAHGWLLPGRWRGHVEESFVGKHLSRLLPTGYGAHTLRHRFATTVYRDTSDLLVVARLLGHASTETTECYVAMPDGRLRQAVAGVAVA